MPNKKLRATTKPIPSWVGSVCNAGAVTAWGGGLYLNRGELNQRKLARQGRWGLFPGALPAPLRGEKSRMSSHFQNCVSGTPTAGQWGNSKRARSLKAPETMIRICREPGSLPTALPGLCIARFARPPCLERLILVRKTGGLAGGWLSRDW